MSISQEVVLVTLKGFDEQYRYQMLSKLLPRIRPEFKGGEFAPFLRKCNITADEYEGELLLIYLNLDSTCGISMTSFLRLLASAQWSKIKTRVLQSYKNKITPAPTWDDLICLFHNFRCDEVQVLETMLPVLLKRGNPTEEQILNTINDVFTNEDRLKTFKLLEKHMPPIKNMETYERYLATCTERKMNPSINEYFSEQDWKEKCVMFLVDKLEINTGESVVAPVEEKKEKDKNIGTFIIEIEGHAPETVTIDWNKFEGNYVNHLNSRLNIPLRLYRDGHYERQ